MGSSLGHSYWKIKEAAKSLQNDGKKCKIQPHYQHPIPFHQEKFKMNPQAAEVKIAQQKLLSKREKSFEKLCGKYSIIFFLSFKRTVVPQFNQNL